MTRPSDDTGNAQLRSSRVDVRNPLTGLPSFAKLQSLPPEIRGVLRALLLDLKIDAAARAQKAWASHKAPMAAYWKVVSVIAGHTSRGLR